MLNSGIDALLTLPVVRHSATAGAAMYGVVCGSGDSGSLVSTTAMVDVEGTAYAAADGSTSLVSVLPNNTGNGYRMTATITGVVDGTLITEIGMITSEGTLAALDKLPTPLTIYTGDVLTVTYVVNIVNGAPGISTIQFKGEDYQVTTTKLSAGSGFAHNFSTFYADTGGITTPASYLPNTFKHTLSVRKLSSPSVPADGVKTINLSCGYSGGTAYNATMNMIRLDFSRVGDPTKGLRVVAGEGIRLLNAVEFVLEVN